MNKKSIDLPRAEILVVDDNPDNVRLLINILNRHGYKIRPATSASRALAVARNESPNLILLDIMMPGTSGYSISQQLQADERTNDIPIIFISALNDVSSKVKAFQSGGVDYITKPFQPDEVLARVKTHLDLHNAQKMLTHTALHDSLTGLPNRTYFNRKLAQVFEKSEQVKDYQCTLLFIDLDRFKAINDNLGHTVGDQLLMAIAQRLQKTLGPDNTIARFGGDEFIVLLNNLKNIDQAYQQAEDLQHALIEPFEIGDHQLITSCSIGIVSSLAGPERLEDCLRHASLAMYQAKRQGGGKHVLFNAQKHSEAESSWLLETDLRDVLKRKELKVFFQPVIDISCNRIVGLEALLRWQHPEQGLLNASRFVPILESTGQIVEVGRRVLETACAQTHNWNKAGFEQLWVAVNLSMMQFQTKNLATDIETVLDRTGLPAYNLALEISENVNIEQIDNGLTALERLANIGVHLFLDDFGIGPTITLLRHLPINQLKIDKSFIKELPQNPNDAKFVQAIAALASSLKLGVIAEGVEKEEQLNMLKSIGINQFQGNLFGSPLPADEMSAFLSQSKQSGASQ